MRRISAFALVLAIAGHASAQDDALQRAQALFNVGAQAYAQGEYKGAIEAFEAAYRASPRPGILFSLAQAHRKQFYATHEPGHLRAAIAHYREYIGTVSSGKYRVIAVDALAELEGLATKLGVPATEAPQAAEKPRTRVMVSCSVDGARVALDGGALQPSPLIADVTPNKHTVRVEADGYYPDTRPVVAVEGGLVALDVPLRARPATLFVRAESGADVLVDRRPVGRTPLTGPIELGAGPHFIALTHNGRRPYGEEIRLARGESKRLDVDLGGTTQRTIAYVVLGSAAASFVAGGVFIGMAFYEQGQAESIQALAGQHNITQAQEDSYNSSVNAREGLKLASYVAFGGAAALALGASALFLFDTPHAPLGPTREREEEPTRKPTSSPLEVSAVPLVAPGVAGLGLVGSF